jgi:hypothetical protein
MSFKKEIECGGTPHLRLLADLAWVAVRIENAAA